MVNKVNKTPAIQITPDTTYIYSEFVDHAARLNGMLAADGSERATAPVLLAEYTVAGLPSAAVFKSGIIAVTNETGGYTLAFSDGTNWRRVQDRAIVS